MVDPPQQLNPYRGVKRCLDIALASTMLLIGSPLVLIIAAAIKWEDGGPVFYRQSRWGLRGAALEVLKFRTMRCGAGLEPAREDDERITRVGRWLRGAGLDELPQLINILRGEMSFVGPRPLAIGEILVDRDGQRVRYDEIPRFGERLSVVPGLTSLATVYLPKDTHPTRKLRYDLVYVKKQSLSLDLYLILVSFWISFAAKWESRNPRKLHAGSSDLDLPV